MERESIAANVKIAWPEDDVFRADLEALGTQGTADKYGTTARTVRKRKAKLGIVAVGSPDEVTFTIDKQPPVGGWTPDALLEAHGMDPSAWVVTNVKAVGNQWGDREDPNEQVKLVCSARPVRIGPLIRPPDLTDWKPIPKPKPRKKGKGNDPLRAVVISDHHAPRNEKTFHRLFVQWLRDHQPDIIHVNGDLLDFPSVSRHRTEDDFNHDVNECLAAGYRILRDYRDACPNASISYLRGNHSERLRHYLHDNAPELKDVRPGGDPDEIPWHNLRRLLWLDELHVDYTDEPWEQAKKTLGRRLTARHGFSTSPNAGKIILDKLSGSTIQGHDHRFWMQLRTRHTGDVDDPIEVRLAMSVGCACEIPGGLNYVNGGEPDWQNAAAAVDIYADDDFYCSPMLYVPGRLLCREGRYS